MPYHEASFLDGLAHGLTATAGCPNGATRKTLLTGVRRLISGYPDGAFDTFVSRVSLRTDSAVTILYEYGPADADTLTRDFRKVGASDAAQTFHHVVRTPQAFALRAFHYNAYLLEQDGMQIGFNARFIAFPCSDHGTPLYYPGAPEAVNVWWTQTSR